MKKLTIIVVLIATLAIMIPGFARAQELFQKTFTALSADPIADGFKPTGFACITALDPVQDSGFDVGLTYALRICEGDTREEYAQRACRSKKPGNRTVMYMLKAKAKVVMRDCAKQYDGTFVYFEQKEGSSSDVFETLNNFKTEQAVVNQVLVDNTETIIRGEQVIVAKVDVMACEARVGRYNDMAMVVAESKFKGCVGQRSTILDLVNSYRANEGDRWGEPASRKDNNEDRLVGNLVEFSCKGKGKVALVSPASCQTDPNILKGM